MRLKIARIFWIRELLTNGHIGSFSIVCDVLVDDCLGAFLHVERLVLSVLGDELGLQLH